MKVNTQQRAKLIETDDKPDAIAINVDAGKVFFRSSFLLHLLLLSTLLLIFYLKLFVVVARVIDRANDQQQLQAGNIIMIVLHIFGF